MLSGFFFGRFLAGVALLVSERAALQVSDPFGVGGLLRELAPLAVLLALLVYLPLVAVGFVAWRARGKSRPPERLPGRERALPPPPRGPHA